MKRSRNQLSLTILCDNRDSRVKVFESVMSAFFLEGKMRRGGWLAGDWMGGGAQERQMTSCRSLSCRVWYQVFGERREEKKVRKERQGLELKSGGTESRDFLFVKTRQSALGKSATNQRSPKPRQGPVALERKAPRSPRSLFLRTRIASTPPL